MVGFPSDELYAGTRSRGKRIAIVPHDVPVAKAINKETMNDKVGSKRGSTPFEIQAAKRRSAPMAVIIAPDAQASVNTMRAKKMRLIPNKKDSTDSPTDMRKRGTSRPS
mmetsp:Transcript_8751/g.21978  ORF Transcript_8751/g.21978 Transcript_8751/m.21978 type:complete len:109 (+) Transcript_8751:834-1160(+)